MINANSIAAPQEVKENNATNERSYGSNSPARVLAFLYERAKNLDVAELKFLARSTETASFAASQLATSISNIGCMISADGMPGQMRAGNFEDNDNVSQLLFAIADQVSVIGELAHIGSECEFTLRHMGVKSV